MSITFAAEVKVLVEVVIEIIVSGEVKIVAAIIEGSSHSAGAAKSSTGTEITINMVVINQDVFIKEIFTVLFYIKWRLHCQSLSLQSVAVVRLTKLN